MCTKLGKMTLVGDVPLTSLSLKKTHFMGMFDKIRNGIGGRRPDVDGAIRVPSD